MNFKMIEKECIECGERFKERANTIHMECTRCFGKTTEE